MEWTEERKKAHGERVKAMWAKKRAMKNKKKRVIRKKRVVKKEYPLEGILVKVLETMIDRRISMYFKERIVGHGEASN